MSLDDKNLSIPDSDDTPEDDNPFSAFEEVGRVDKKQNNRKKVNKRRLSLILTSVGAVLLAAVLLLLTLLPQAGTNGSSTSSAPVVDTTITVLDKTVKDTVVLRRVDVENAKGSYSLIYNANHKRMQIKGFEDIAMDAEVENTLLAYTTVITARDKVHTPGAAVEYGLDKPQAKAAITYADGTVVTLSVGNSTASKDAYYVQVSGDNNVYIFESDCVYLFMVEYTAYADTTLLTTPTVKKDDANGSALLKEISYSGKNHPQPLRIRRSYYTDSEEMTLFSYIISKPYMRGITDDVIGQLSTFKGLKATQALYLHPTAEQKKKMGFNNPLIVMNLTMAVETSENDKPSDTSAQAEKKIYYNSYSTTVTVGNVDSSSNYIVMVEGIDAIFLVDHSALAPIAERTYENSVNQLLFLKNIGELGRISITVDGQRHDFRLTHYPEKENRDEKMVVTKDGKVYPTSDFRELYQQLMGLERYGSTTDRYSKDAALKVDIYTTSGEHYLGATYYPLSGTLCAVETSEGEIFTTRWHYVTHFVEQVKNYLNGDPVRILT